MQYTASVFVLLHSLVIAVRRLRCTLLDHRQPRSEAVAGAAVRPPTTCGGAPLLAGTQRALAGRGCCRGCCCWRAACPPGHIVLQGSQQVAAQRVARNMAPGSALLPGEQVQLVWVPVQHICCFWLRHWQLLQVAAAAEGVWQQPRTALVLQHVSAARDYGGVTCTGTARTVKGSWCRPSCCPTWGT